MSMLGGRPDGDICSRAGCLAPALWELRWRNPAIHSADRVKIWLACDEHRDFLSEFLRARDFPLSVIPFEVAS
jgi:hypothetical protein